MARAKFTPGRVMRIPLEDGQHTYGRMLGASPHVAYHDFRTTDENPDLIMVARSPILFIVATSVYWELSKQPWSTVGQVPLTQVDTDIPPNFWQSIADSNRLKIIDHLGNERPATFEECQGLEMLAVWQPEHVENRLNDYYAGRENMEYQHLRPVKPS